MEVIMSTKYKNKTNEILNDKPIEIDDSKTDSQELASAKKDMESYTVGTTGPLLKNSEPNKIEIFGVKVIGCSALNIRKDSNTSSDVLEVVPEGTILSAEKITGETGFDWIRVKGPSTGKFGYSMAQYLLIL